MTSNERGARPVHDENPLLDYLGIGLVRWGPGKSEFRIAVEARHLNRAGNLQGGVIATILDAACGYAGLWSDAESAPGNAVTTMLTVSYLAKANVGILTATGRVTKAGRKLYFASGELIDASGTLIAIASGTFMHQRPR
ncbi:PaaI family thioesterase [Sphingomonas arantia]|uniref:PaaI family thioesterase n=2 Tax=Sphingomonas arantia TaxID=1460676 RepID=A0ABW4TZW6_9SPHN